MLIFLPVSKSISSTFPQSIKFNIPIHIHIFIFTSSPQHSINVSDNKIKQKMKLSNKNSFEPVQELDAGDDNQFLLSSGRLSANSKDQLINNLVKKNKRLKDEIDRIDSVLNSKGPKVNYGVKIPQSRYETANKQLGNVYKQIKSYEYEIKKIQGLQDSGNYVEQIKKCETILKEKEELSGKLRRRLGEIKKGSMEVTKQLKDDVAKDFYVNKADKLRNENKYLRQKIKQLENKKGNNKKNFQNQGLFVIKLEHQLLKAGMHEEQIKAIKSKYTNNEDTKQSSYYGANEKNHDDIEEEDKNFVEDRTPQAYRFLMNEIKLLEKMERDYKGQLKIIEDETQQACSINLKARNKLLEVEDDIQKVQKRINELKDQIDPRNMKPQRALSMMMRAGVGRYGKVNKSLAQIKSPFKSLFKTEQIGEMTKAGKRFSDRIKLGKNKAKIVAIDLYENKFGLKNLVGIQVTYDVQGAKKKSAINMIHDSKLAEKKSFVLEEDNDFINSVQCIMNEKQTIVGIGFRSMKGVSIRGGILEGSKRPLNIGGNEYPTALFGSFSPEGIQLFGCEIVE